ncbi:retrovirus-related pol polyprotein from transposon TNT 1-94 [Tanacetum coccineum]
MNSSTIVSRIPLDYKFKWTEKTVPVAEGSSETTIEGYMENYKNVSQDIRDQLNAEAKIYKPTNNNLKTSSNTSRANQDNSLRINRGIGYDNQRTVNVAGAKDNVGTQVVQQSEIQCYNFKEYGHVAREFACRDDTDDEHDYQELEAYYMYMAQIQEVTPHDADNSGPRFDTGPLQKVQNDNDNYNVFANDSEHPEQPESINDIYPEEQGRDLLASLTDKLKCEIDDSKNRNKLLESSNKTLVDNLKDLKKFQAKLDRYHDVNYASKVEIDCAKEKGDLMSHKMESQKEYYYADNMNAILSVYTTLDEFTNLQCDYVDQVVKCERLEKELSQSNITSKSFEVLQQHAIDLELALQQHLKAQLKDKGIAISELKKLIEKMKGKSVETKFEKSSIIRQSNAFKSQRQSVLGKPTIFSDSLEKKDFSKSKSVTKNNVSNDFSKPVTAQILPQNTNVIAPGMYKVHTEPNQTRTPQLPQDIRKTNKRVSFSTGVIPTTSVSRPQLKSNRMGDRVMPNNSQGMMQEVEDHRRNFKFSNNKTFVTACNDSLNAKTSNVNFVCVTCGKCVINDNHDLCVQHYINGVNSRTRQPIVVPISTREPKHNVNQSVATSSKKTVATDSTVKKSRNITRKLYEQVSKTCSWWYPKYTPPGYNWKPKSQIGNVNPKVSMPLRNASRTANILEPMTPRCSTISNTPLSSNSFVARSCGTDLYSITLQDSPTPNPICLMAKTRSSQAWLWYRRLSHLNFDSINLLSKNNILNGLPKLKFVKDHLCSSCELGKAKRKSFHTKTTPSSKRRLQLLHMDLCGPMRVESINGKKYVLVIVDDYSRYTWTHFLRSKDETPEVLIDFLTLIQRGLHAQVRTVRTDKGTEFLNKTLHAYFAKEGIRHETSTARTPEQNGVVERRNRTLVEAARTMLSAAKVPLFFWAEAIATTCFTQNRSLVIPRHEKTPYHIINARKPSVKFFHIFGSLCYIIRDGENLDKMKEKGDACIFC